MLILRVLLGLVVTVFSPFNFFDYSFSSFLKPKIHYPFLIKRIIDLHVCNISISLFMTEWTVRFTEPFEQFWDVPTEYIHIYIYIYIALISIFNYLFDNIIMPRTIIIIHISLVHIGSIYHSYIGYRPIPEGETGFKCRYLRQAPDSSLRLPLQLHLPSACVRVSCAESAESLCVSAGSTPAPLFYLSLLYFSSHWEEKSSMLLGYY